MDNHAYDPYESLIFLTNRVGRLLANQIRKESTHPDFPRLFPHMGVLVDLWMKDGVRQQDLAVATIKDKGTITRSITTMEQMNIVVRIPDAQDKRNKRIYLTHKGKELRSELLPYAEAVIESATTGIPPEEVRTCKKVLQQMYLQLNEQTEQKTSSQDSC